jgi:hypothetical protein
MTCFENLSESEGSNVKITSELIQNVMETADENEDGRLSREEFEGLFRRMIKKIIYALHRLHKLKLEEEAAQE